MNDEVILLKVNIEMFGCIDNEGLKKLLERDANLKAYVDHEMDRISDEGIINSKGPLSSQCNPQLKKCPSCGGCPSQGKASSCNRVGHGGCGTYCDWDTAYLSLAASCIMDYYLPSHVKEIFSLNSTSSLEK